MTPDRRTFLAAAGAGLISPALARAESPAAVFRPEDFGAKGDGVTNDTAAFARLSAAVARRGGGTISLAPKRTYIVGSQRRDFANFAWGPAPIIELDGLTGQLTIHGNGARLRCAPGLRFGVFDPATGEPLHRKMPNSDPNGLASPYRGLIHVSNCRGAVEVRDLELDGNLDRLRIGGQFGDAGWQLPGTGLLLEGNLADETVTNVYTHHHPQDGAMIIGLPRRIGRTRISHFVSRYNARQGLSLTGGHGYDFADCEFSHTGRSAIMSQPGAGLDIEAEANPIRDLTFARCKFINNTGVGMLADSGDSEAARFTDCLFVGTTTWSAWPYKPRFRFARCTFVGSVVHPFASADAAKATHFLQCRFTDNPRLSPTGKVFTPDGPIVNMGESDNVLFDGCTFTLVGEGTLPWSWRAIYKDCVMSQRSKAGGMTKGRYLGRTTISGPVSLYGSMIEGTVILDGKPVPRGPVGVKPW
jgi:hypothetical protein